VYGIDRALIDEAVRQGINQQSDDTKFGLVGEGGLSIQYQVAATRLLNINVPFSDEHFTRYAPGQAGGTAWYGPAYNPSLNLVFTGMMDWASSVKLAPLPLSDLMPNQLWMGSHDGNFGQQDPKSKWGGYLTALDADNGDIRWQVHTPTPLISGVTTTSGGLVFCGDLNGDFIAYDARTGKQLWKHHIGEPMAAGVISYESGGRQYIAVAAGITSPNAQVTAGTARIVIYRLP
jgi:alcohol dehydrogenase (cytochrome c)